MAWLMRKSISIEDSPHVHWTDESIQRILRANAEVAAKFCQLPPDHAEYIEESDAPAGLPIALPGKPLEAYIEQLHAPLPDFLTQSIVNSRVKDTVEAVEPGVHQFTPAIVRMPDGSRDEAWWTMRQCHRVDALAFELCQDVHKYRPRPEQHPNWYYYRSNHDRRMKLVVRKKIVDGFAMWYDWRFQETFLGESLGQLLMDNGIRGICLPKDELGRSLHVAEVDD